MNREKLKRQIRIIIGLCMIGICLFIGYQRNFILELEHVVAVDTAFYAGVLVGVMMVVSIQLIKK